MITEEKMLEFKSLQIALRELKAEEAAMRIEICDELLKGKVTGTHTFHYGDVTVKAVKKVSTTVDAEMLSHLYQGMNEDERACFKYKPAYVSPMYKRLDFKDLVDSVLITKPAMPGLEVKIPDA